MRLPITVGTMASRIRTLLLDSNPIFVPTSAFNQAAAQVV